VKKFKEFVIAFFALCIIVSLFILVYKGEIGRRNTDVAKRMAELSPRGGPPETIEGLKKAIEIYEEQVEKNIRDGVQTGAYWKILAIRLSDRGMYHDSLNAFERALYYIGDDPTLFYLIGVAAGNAAKNTLDFAANSEMERNRLFKLSETAYLRAIELDNNYTKPMYGLAVLYVFELKRYEEAIPYLDRLVSMQTSNINSLAVLAQAYYLAGRHNLAVETYEKIIKATKDKKIQEEALRNIEIIERRLYE
jgi:tetratricopeptide (TPR) repeat protein